MNSLPSTQSSEPQNPSWILHIFATAVPGNSSSRGQGLQPPGLTSQRALRRQKAAGRLLLHHSSLEPVNHRYLLSWLLPRQQVSHTV